MTSDNLKITFQLTAHEKSLEVRAEAFGGQSRTESTLPPSSLIDRLAEHNPTHFPSSVIELVGKELYDRLVAGEVAKLVRDILNEGMIKNIPVQFELRFDADQILLSQFPWEMITDSLGQMLVYRGMVDMTRYITFPQPPPVFDNTLLNSALLRIIAHPPQMAPITTVDLNIEKLLTLTNATFEHLIRKLLIERVELWGVQFDGHGALVTKCAKCDTLNDLDVAQCRKCGTALDNARQVGALAFERNGGIDWITTDEFGSILYNARVQIALLLSCESSRVGNHFLFSGLSPSLVLAGVPAVIGMQYPVLDSFANSFAQNFYDVLLKSNNVIEAMRVARRTNALGAWYSPTLYLRHQHSNETEKSSENVFHTRNIDSTTPASIQIDQTFLVRLWIRRPKTKPLSDQMLRRELDIPEEAPIITRETEAEVEFESVEGRKLRRGEVEVKLNSIGCTVTPESIKLFIDEHLDAPPAIFTIQPCKVGRASLIFSVWQDGGQIASVTHHIQVEEVLQEKKIASRTFSLPIEPSEAVSRKAELVSKISPRIFISSVSHDQTIAIQLANELRYQGAEVALSVSASQLSQVPRDKILTSDFYVPILSTKALDSILEPETALAQQYNIPIIPVWLQRFGIPVNSPLAKISKGIGSRWNETEPEQTKHILRLLMRAVGLAGSSVLAHMTLKGHERSVSPFAFSPDSSLLAFASGNRAYLRQLQDGPELTVAMMHPEEQSVRSLAISPNGSCLVSGAKHIRVWEMPSGRLLAMHTEDDSATPDNLVFSPDGQYLATQMGKWIPHYRGAGLKHRIELRRMPSGQRIAALTKYDFIVTSMAFSPDSALLAAVQDGRKIIFWTLPTAQSARIVNLKQYTLSIAFSPDASLLITCANDHSIRLFDAMDTEQMKELAVFTGHESTVWAVAFSPDGRLLASASEDFTIRLWHIPTGRQVGVLTGHMAAVSSVSFSPDGSLLASASYDGTIKLWKMG